MWFRRRSNRRTLSRKEALVTGVRGAWTVLGPKLFFFLRLAAVGACLAGAIVGGRATYRAMVNSPRFAIASIQVPELAHVGRDELVALAAVHEGDPLLLVRPDQVAARLATHPWIASARVVRSLPATLRLEIEERRAVALAVLGGLYLVDERGVAFKRATPDEADGMVVLTGIERDLYADAVRRPIVEAAFREAVALLGIYRATGDRPKIGEVNIDPDSGFALFLADGAGELRVGNKDFAARLARFDAIWNALPAEQRREVRVLHLAEENRGGPHRVPVLMASAIAN